MSFQNRLAMFNTIGPMGTPRATRPEQEIADSIQDHDKLTRFEEVCDSSQQNFIHRKARRTTTRRPTKLNDLLVHSQENLPKEELKPSINKIQRSATISTISSRSNEIPVQIDKSETFKERSININQIEKPKERSINIDQQETKKEKSININKSEKLIEKSVIINNSNSKSENVLLSEIETILIFVFVFYLIFKKAFY